MTRRSLLLGVVLVNVDIDELCCQLVAAKFVGVLSDSSAFEGEPDKLGLTLLPEPRGGSDGKVGTANVVSFIWNGAPIVVGSATVGRDPGFRVDV